MTLTVPQPEALPMRLQARRDAAPDPLVRQFFLGFIRTHILFHADSEPVCGADLAGELERHGYRLSPGTLYPMLHALERQGYLRARFEVRQGRRCKQYRITTAGRRALGRVRQQIKELVEEVLGHE